MTGLDIAAVGAQVFPLDGRVHRHALGHVGATHGHGGGSVHAFVAVELHVDVDVAGRSLLRGALNVGGVVVGILLHIGRGADEALGLRVVLRVLQRTFPGVGGHAGLAGDGAGRHGDAVGHAGHLDGDVVLPEAHFHGRRGIGLG